MLSLCCEFTIGPISSSASITAVVQICTDLHGAKTALIFNAEHQRKISFDAATVICLPHQLSLLLSTMNTRSTKPNKVTVSPAPSPPSYTTLDDLEALLEHLNSTNVTKIDKLHLSVDEMESAMPSKLSTVMSKFDMVNGSITTLAS